MAATVASELCDGPVLSVINKRIRALKKKYNRIIQMEESVSQGKALHKEQEETLRSKPFVIAGIEELEKLKQPLSVALSEEISAALQRQHLDAPTSTVNSTTIAETSSITSNKEDEEEEQQQHEEESPEKSDKEGKGLEPENGNLTMVEDLLNLLYFGSMFDVKSQHDFTATMLTRTHERGCCLTYDYVTDDDASDLLGERDLDLISMLGGLLISRPVNSSLSHKNALQRCIEHAKLWLAKSNQPIQVDSTITYAGLREKLNKIMASDYITTTPEMKAPVEMVAAVETYGSFQVPVVHDPVMSIEPPVLVQGSAVQYEEQLPQEEVVVSPQGQGDGVYKNQTDPREEFDQGEGGENFSELPGQTDSLVQSELGQNPQEFDKVHHYASRRTFQNHRGGRGMGGGSRRGYPNGRGGRAGGRGGGYSNGRQYYDYPRNYYRGRGGRGGSYPGQGSYLVGDA